MAEAADKQLSIKVGRTRFWLALSLQFCSQVKAQDGTEVFFKVKPTTPFSKIFSAYCKKIGTDTADIRFLFEGARVSPDQTPADLDMSDEDCIDAMVHQVGGSV